MLLVLSQIWQVLKELVFKLDLGGISNFNLALITICIPGPSRLQSMKSDITDIMFGTETPCNEAWQPTNSISEVHRISHFCFPVPCNRVC